MDTASAPIWLIIGILLGGLVAGLVDVVVGEYRADKEGRGIARALAAELGAMLTLAQVQRYGEGLDAILLRLRMRDPNQALTLEDIFAIRVTQDYFTVFTAVAPKLGMLENLSGEVVTTYSVIKSFLEDAAALANASDALIRGEKNPLHHTPYLLAITQGARAKLTECMNRRTVVNNLESYAKRRRRISFGQG